MPLSLFNLGNAEVSGARVTTLLPRNYETARDVTIIDAPDEGRLTVNPDNSLALVLTGSDYTGPLSFTGEVVAADGSTSRQTVNLRVTEPSQEGGWGTGADHYMLETDADGELIIETGDNHREVYVSASPDALTIADIAAREGISTSAVNGEWLTAHPEYGSSPGMALAVDVGMELWQELSAEGGPSSHWLRLERGFSYDTLGGRDLMPRGIEGEDELHPVVITSYGNGEQPIITSGQYLAGETFSNIVLHDLHITEDLQILGPDDVSGNVILDTITASGQGHVIIQNANGITARDLNFHDLAWENPVNGRTWEASPDKFTSLYGANIDGMLIENSIFATIGWEEGYDPSGRADPQTPSMFSHNVYMNSGVSDLTFRDNISAQASSYGGQLRSGGFVEGNLFLDNNAGFVVRGGDFYGFGPIGNFSLLSGNVVTSASYKVADAIGAYSRGLVNGGLDTSLVDNIVAHLADPDQPSELDYKEYSNGAVINENQPYYDDTIVYGWFGGLEADRGDADAENRNIDGLNTTRLDDTTAANLAKIVLNDPTAGLEDLVDWLGENDIEADTLNAYFQDAFGVLQDARTSATTLRFIPNEIGDGVRWDNRINWSTEDLPGTVVGDSVDLGGNWVVYGGTNTIRTLGFGDGGQLDISNGRLDVSGRTYAAADGGTINLTAAGQFWLGTGHIGVATLNVSLDGGRFANTGTITDNVDLFVDDGQALLSADGGDFTLGSGERLVVRGADAQVGFDGASNQLGVISFDAGSEVVFMSDETGLGSISEFRSGAYGDAPHVNSHIDLGEVDVVVDLSATNGMANGTYTLMRADEITGNIDSFDVIGLASNRSAVLTVNYTNDVVHLTIDNGAEVAAKTVGDTSNNHLVGMDLDEEFYSGPGHDLIQGFGGDDVIETGYGIDIACGHEGNDVINTGADRDLAYGGLGNDLIRGGAGQDWLRGGSDNDTINGQEGSDQIQGGWGNDLLTGGAGNGVEDVFVFARDGRDWGDVITDFEVGVDKLVLGDVETGFRGYNGIELTTQDGNAVIWANNEYIVLRGVTAQEVTRNAEDIFGDASDLLYEEFSEFTI
ncbi:Ca2+-binding RTX toxin-like protein [Primorskyibacter sedentarius]|uniref:Ca2+-binding RTX toxin-like protein n=1 Tax=Primorskyibacter sedentarius TaxID=745311 RepID=A0A4R3J1Z5_9RHOB|nr:calcium-binding protein [Primorskyibacter sedentarius]TCS59819.1 Ca2+-binding RTX toxin-like protein [Primorskyibacter sedentarius]